MTTRYQKLLRVLLVEWLTDNYADKFNIDFDNVLLLENMNIPKYDPKNKYNTCIYRFNPAYDQDTINIVKDLISKLLDSHSIEYSMYIDQTLYEKKHTILRILNGNILLTILQLT